MKKGKLSILAAIMVIAMICSSVTAMATDSKGEGNDDSNMVYEPVYQDLNSVDHLIINQVYGGGGKGETPITNSFVELYNPTGADVSLSGYKLINGASTLELTGTVKAGGSWLVVGKEEETSDDFQTYDLPTADQTWDIAISNKNYTIELKNSLGDVDSVTADENISAVKISKQKSLRRIDHKDTDDNSDFEIVEWKKDEEGISPVNMEFIAKYAPANSNKEMGDIHSATGVDPSDPPSEPSYTAVATADVKVEGFNNGNSYLNMQLYARYNSLAMSTDGGSLEIVEYNEANGYAYSVSGLKGKVIATPIKNVSSSDKVVALTGGEYDVKTLVVESNSLDDFVYGDMTSVAISPDGTKLAAAIQHEEYDKKGAVAIFDCNSNGTLTNPTIYEAGVQPDMVTFAGNDTVLVANEGEPRKGYTGGAVDPKGTASIINIKTGTTKEAGFDGFTSEELIEKNVLIGRVDEEDLNPAEDLEPEYIAVSSDGKRAYVTLQEANAIGVLDIPSASFVDVYSVGFEDYSKVAVDIVEDGKYEAETYDNLLGARMPDGLAVYESNGKTYIITANEGDSREWGTYLNEAKTNEFTGSKITVIDDTQCSGLPNGKTVMFGGRGFSVLEVTGSGLEEVYDSKSEFEEITAKYLPDYFNCSNDDVDIDSRSKKKGPEPENVVVGKVAGKTYAFVAIERTGGVMAYDITNPSESSFANYINSREFDAAVQGDVSPEGLCIVNSNGNGNVTLLAACEVSGTLAAYELTSTEIVTDREDSNGAAVTNDKTKVEAVKTSDQTTLKIFLIVLISAATAITGIEYRRKRENR